MRPIPLRRGPSPRPRPLLLLPLLAAALLAGAGIFLWRRPPLSRSAALVRWLRDPGQNTEWTVQARTRCGDAPLLLPTSGVIAYLWDDSFRPGHRHSGIDIFGGGEPGTVPVYAAADGLLTREPTWKSSLILYLPSDPLEPSRPVWIYYTHMADPQGVSYILSRFPPGTAQVPVKAGDLLGYQGNYSGDPAHPVGVHLHLSIVLPDGAGGFRNELQIGNTLDPSPYLGLQLNGRQSGPLPPVCP